MAEYRDTTEKVYVEKKSNTGMVIGTIIVLALVVVGGLCCITSREHNRAFT